MRHAAAVLAVTLIVPPLAAQRPPRHRFGLDDLALLRDVLDPQVSPDGAWVAYVVRSVDKEKDEENGDIWMTSWDGTRHVRLTTSKDDDSWPRWSPDGRWLAFLSARGEDDGDDDAEAQVFLLSRDGGEASPLTDLDGPVQELAWSPDSERLALIVKDPDPEKLEKKKEKDKDKKKTPRPIVVDRYLFKRDYEGYLTDRRSHLSLFHVASKRAEVLTPGSFDERLPSWSPDGERIAFVSKRGEEPDRHWNWDVFVIEAKAGATPRALTSFPGEDGAPQWGAPPAWSPTDAGSPTCGRPGQAGST